jgi:hypothetical protein
LSKVVLCLLAALVPVATLHAQQITTLPDAPQPTSLTLATNDTLALAQTSSSSMQDAPPKQQPETDAQRKARGDAQINEETHQRIAGVLPSFNSVQSDKAIPLTSGQKFHLFLRGSIDPYQFAIAAANAGVEEAEDQYPEYHWGVSGLARRYGASFADTWDGNFWGNAVLPSLLHQDPRYYRLGRESGKTGWHRFFYAAATTVICHGDNGKIQPNVSNIVGNLIGGAISNLYYPDSDRGLGSTLTQGFTTSAEGIIGAELLEFYPDFVAWRQRRHERKLAAHS